MLPAPVSTQDPATATGRPLRWGVVATGTIAARVVADLALLDDAILQAVSSRTEASARAFARRFGFAEVYSDAEDRPGYERLFDDPAVDVVYIATPHAQHHAVAMAALTAGKHVLCEKPLAMNARQAGELADLARDRGLFLMEAVWTRFLPSFCRAAEILRSGEIGSAQWLQADLGFVAPDDPASRIQDPAAGGGALLDLAVYPLTWALGVFGEPSDIVARGALTPEGIDRQNALTLTYASGACAQLLTSIGADSPGEATIAGTEGWLRSAGPLFNPRELVIQAKGGPARTERFEVPGNGFGYELREVTRCLQSGLTDSPYMPPAESVRMMELLDEARRQMGIRYASDAD
ncbi:Gfo/Idh/MocA family protein [Zhihengliuella salsuginis]|uniref:Oxidoreductase n=1 Tax=Zhihengliuella salsuginis TaxID=578222 RepID=A0ABQ3GKW8_9MICC|nr:Gfo/Idh/MocA family oxidoreductase [Zhihengliuella salsuginis]GHD13382.1 oxidoreductase [Zhihengliuella salsuginis]